MTTCQDVHVVDQGSCEIWCGGPSGSQKTYIWDGISCECQGCGMHSCFRNRGPAGSDDGTHCSYTTSGACGRTRLPRRSLC